MPDPDVRLLSFLHKGGIYYAVHIDHGGRRTEVTLSPTGRSVQVFVDGKKWEALDA